MKSLLRILGILMLAAFSGAEANDLIPIPTDAQDPRIPAERLADPGAGPGYANRILFYPVTSFYINGVNGKYERRILNRRLGLSLPFYLGRIDVADLGTNSTWGTGIGLDAFLSAKPSGGRVSASLEAIDIRRQDITDYYGDSDPTFIHQGARSYDKYHQYLLTASLLLCYRWEYPSRRFLLDLGMGGMYSRFNGPQGRNGSNRSEGPGYDLPVRYAGFLPVIHFSIGFPF